MNINSRATVLAALGLGVGLTLSPTTLLAQQAGTAQAVEQEQSQTVDGENAQPTFEIETPIVDLGTILDTEPVAGTIRFRNAGNATLTVPSVSATCGCVVADLPKNDFDPGESIELQVEFDPRGKTAGRHEQTVTFRTNDRANPMVAVKVRAFVKPLISIEPLQVNLGEVTKHTRKETLISLTGSHVDFEAFHVTLVGDGAKYFDVEILGTDPLEVEGESVARTDILVSLRDDAPPGRAQALAAIRTNDDRRKLVTVPVGAQVEGDVVINPARMSLGTMSVGRQVDEVIEIRHGRNEAFKITGVELRPLQPAGMAPMKIDYSVEPLDAEAGANGKAVDGYRVRLVMPGVKEAGRIRGNFVLLTNVPLEEEVMLPYVGRIVDTSAGE